MMGLALEIIAVSVLLDSLLVQFKYYFTITPIILHLYQVGGGNNFDLVTLHSPVS